MNLNTVVILFVASSLPQCKFGDTECLPRVMTTIIQGNLAGLYLSQSICVIYLNKIRDELQEYTIFDKN